MKPAAVRSSSLLVLALVLSLPFASRGEEVRSSDGGGRPYLFGEESFREWTRTPYGRFSVLERFDHELLGVPVGNYRVAVLEAAPRAFLQPRHYDADAILYVMEGEGVVGLLREGKREPFCVREGDVMVIPAGSIVYSTNTHQAKLLQAVMLFNPVSTPGVIYQASEEQIRALSRSCSRGRDSDEELKPCSLPTQGPRYSNNHGTMHVITINECRQLRDLDIEVGFANMNPGSMLAPTYTTRSTRIALVAEGSGYFEIAV
uniref:Uncharacterized protein n=1 Tax=Avena sativa TaxID=4498 RepID=A0ACD5YAS0_AVESA